MNAPRRRAAFLVQQLGREPATGLVLNVEAGPNKFTARRFPRLQEAIICHVTKVGSPRYRSCWMTGNASERVGPPFDLAISIHV